MPKDGSATRRRLLDAATAEFSARGIAGARVDRIAAAAEANKAQIYAWFDSKDGLFDAVFREHLALIVDLVPFDAHDLPGYAVRLYDAYLQRPAVILLAVWARLERVPSGDLLTAVRDEVEGKHAAIAEAQAQGLVDGAFEPADVYSLVIAMSMTWSPAATVVAAAPGDPQRDHTRRREALARAVRGALTPFG
ncbi:TetR family transcriptional regulator [Actinomycetospora sp. NBRC 106378]|uniref:TetR family transcriptional regulator n=1 Tax=Actinomycetospora sp. NBRC 106378 TaxID=3032208 RepID=UPI0024A3E799|nr:TetR family transcriptional regulator [Actinomycetospora sp. NBRC 106378]GLZ54804.1 TetR family transcriptional regulator [Actinomycetospora sp. NBRC 106378]